MKAFILKSIKFLQNLVPWHVWTCQRYQGMYLIMQIDMRKPPSESLVYTFKTNSDVEFIETLMNRSKCSLQTSRTIFQELQCLTVNSVSLQHNKKDYTILKRSNLRADLRDKPLFPI